MKDHTMWLTITGMAAVALWNGWQWLRDRALAQRSCAEQEDRSQRVSAADAAQSAGALNVSVLVAAWNEAEMIDDHIRSFLALSYPRKQLILCAGGPDGTYRLASAYASSQVKVLEQHPGEGKQGALRRCLEQADGEILYLTDADCLLSDGAFVGTLAPLLQGLEEATTGTSRPLLRQESNPFVIHQWCTDLYVNARQPDYVTGLLGRNCAVRREALLEAGGFDADVRTGTDYYLGKCLVRAGYKIRWVRDGAVHTRYPDTCWSYWRRQSRWVRNLWLHAPAFGAVKELRLAQLTALAGLAMLGTPLAAAIAAGLGAHTAVGWLLGLYSVLLMHAVSARLRYLRFAHLFHGVNLSWRSVLLTPAYLLADWAAWTAGAVDLVVRRKEW